ncbi:uncharacterized protein LOC125955435 [Anopheles darlingi]|uniref:uncharacterized protein LOC125955435 n=1 Tax=Anopheles darlingi TaxID=43151 RepID=UPI002100216E|nr:uncharacterized protein LOC125955435 [Anopheles darlingi]
MAASKYQKPADFKQKMNSHDPEITQHELERISKYIRLALRNSGRIEEKVVRIGTGFYWHLGIANMLNEALSDYPNMRQVFLTMSTDGVVLRQPGIPNRQVWPIVITIENVPAMSPLLVGMYFGRKKPPCTFLRQFVDELNHLSTGSMICGKMRAVFLRKIIADMEAQYIITGTVAPCGSSGCRWCDARRAKKGGSYPIYAGNYRTNVQFRSLVYAGHYRCKKNKAGKATSSVLRSPLVDLDYDVVYEVLLCDPLHNLHKGVMKELMQVFWRKSDFGKKRQFNKIVTNIRIYSEAKMAKSFAKMSVSKNDLTWRASHYANLLNYAGPALFQQILNEKDFKSFMKLHSAISILSHSYFRKDTQMAAELLATFLADYKKVNHRITLKLHALCHISKQVELFGPLPENSTAVFEKYYAGMRRTIGKGDLEKMKLSYFKQFAKFTADPNGGKLVLLNLVEDGIYSSIKFGHKFILKGRFAQKWFLTRDFKVMAMKSAMRDGEDTIINAQELGVYNKCSFAENAVDLLQYESPMAEQFLDHQTKVSCKQVLCKLVVVELNINGIKKFYFIPEQGSFNPLDT